MFNSPLVNSLAYRQALTSVFVAFIIGTTLSAAQVVFDWFQQKDHLQENIIQVMRTLEKPASQALYTVDRTLAGIVVKGLMEYKSVYRAALVDEFDDVYAKQEESPPTSLWRTLFMKVSDTDSEFSIPLVFGAAKRNVGHLDVSLDIYNEMFNFFERAIMTFLSGMLRNFTLAFCLIIAFNLTLVRPLRNLIADIAMLKPGGEKTSVGIPKTHEKTELGLLAENANRIFALYEENTRSLHAVENELRDQKQILERTVDQRTKELQKINKKLSMLSQVDPLTGAANRRCFDKTLSSEWDRAKRTGQPLALAMVDVDHFKAFNDTYGHLEGDECLKLISDILSEHTKRSGEMVARYGGEEFALILPSISMHEAVALVDSIRLKIASLKKPNQQATRKFLTVCAGVAAMVPTDGASPQTLIGRADQQLYLAKGKGRNRVEPNPTVTCS